MYLFARYFVYVVVISDVLSVFVCSSYSLSFCAIGTEINPFSFYHAWLIMWVDFQTWFQRLYTVRFVLNAIILLVGCQKGHSKAYTGSLIHDPLKNDPLCLTQQPCM